MLNALRRSILVLAPVVVLLAGAAFPVAGSADDNSEVMQLAQLTAGFDPAQKYMMSCFACHSTGAAGAPKVAAGTISDWEPRLEKGMDAIMTNVINGLNAMPPKGLCIDCTDDDLRAIVNYMLETARQ